MKSTLCRLLALITLLLCAGPALAVQVLFIATGNVPQGKFKMLAEVAHPHGVTLDVRYLHRLPADVDGSLFKGADVVLVDSYLQDEVRARLHRALPALRAPQLWLYDAHPIWSGLPDDVAKRLVGYYTNGGRANFDGFFRTLAAQLAGRSTAGIPGPRVFPKTGIYHPKAPELIFNDTSSYLRWKGVDPERRPPTVAVLIHQQYVISEQTGFIDDLIARIEAAGALPLTVYAPATGQGALSSMLKPNGHVVADAIINTQVMLDPESRRAEFSALGVPVVQATPYRKGDEATWAADPNGIALMDVPFYVAQAEYAGVTDIQIAAATRKADDQLIPITAQTASMVNKAINLARLARTPNADKHVSIFFWNYPPGEKNLSASFLNLPKSLTASLAALHGAGYRTETPTDHELTLLLQRLLAPFYAAADDNRALTALLRDGLAEPVPVADYRRWFNALPADVRNGMITRWGEPERSSFVVQHNGQAVFAVPRLKLGHITILPQTPRGERWEDKEKAIYHSTKAGPSHFYFATYLLARRDHAIVHYGTHGTQEWLPGKERGLSVFDAPMLAVGDVPVVYPYIVDDVGEAIQAKRRGRAVTISHQTPPFAPAGLHDALTRIHDLLHRWIAQDDGAVKNQLRADLLANVRHEHIDRDMGWSAARIDSDFNAFIDTLHNHLHELAQTAQPQGLHTFGTAPREAHRLGTVLLMLGSAFWEAAAAHTGTPQQDLDEALVGNYDQLATTAPYRLLRQHVIDGAPTDGLPPALRDGITQARQWYAHLGAAGEQPALLAALAGQHIPTSYGGDPIKNPDAYPTGHNLYGFDPSRVPTPQAWAAGKEALNQLLATHRAQTGRTPQKLTMALWSVETMRHSGILEAQAFWAMGVEPVWDAGGRVTGVKLIPRDQLGRARVDVVLSATGLYRDHFPNVMKWLAEAARLAAQADAEADNPVARNAQRIAAQLEARGVDAQAARRAGQTRIFSSEQGNYGTGLDDAALATDTWKGKDEGDRKLAQLYLSRMQYAYGPDEKEWGRAGAGGVANINLYAEHLRGTEGAVLSRTSNLYGMLTTDDPFQYLGGIALAVRHLDGKAPELYISNLRGSGSGKVEGAAQFLAKELATRQFHPGYIKGLMAEGYAGTLQVLDATNNFWGWTAVAREIVRDDQWQELVDVYVRDKHKLGLKDWFERENPHALAQTIERMLEAQRKGYWQTDDATVAELKQRYRELAQRFDVKTDNAAFAQHVGFGLSAPASARPAAATPATPPPSPAQPEAAKPQPTPPPPVVQGMRLDKTDKTEPSATIDILAKLATVWLVVVTLGIGAWRQWRQPRQAALSPRAAALSIVVLSALVSALMPGHAHANTRTNDKVLFFSPAMGKPSQQAKYAAIARAAQEQGLSVEYRFADELKPAAAAAAFGAYRVVVFDSLAGPETLATLAAEYGPAVARNPQLHAVAAGLPGTPLTQNAPAGIEKEVHLYLENGGRENFRRLVQFMRVQLLQAQGAIEPPILFPQEALYHPDAPSLVFNTTAHYLKWRPIQAGQPTVAVIFHRNHLAADSLAPIDATIRALEKRGLAVLPYYSDIIKDYLGEKFVMSNGKPLAQVIITHQAMIMEAEKIRTQAARIGLPILHALHYRDGQTDVWQKDPSGIHLTQVPMTLVMPEIIGFSDPLIVAAQDAQTKRMDVIGEQLDALAGKAANLARLATRSNVDKKIAVFFYNYPPGVSNLGAAFLDIPKSLAALTQALQKRGYRTEPHDAKFFETQAWAMLKPWYSDNVPDTARALIKDGYAELWPVSAYRRWYDRLPQPVRASIEKQWGPPEKSSMTIMHNGKRHFVITRMLSGNNTVILPQPRRSENGNYRDDAALYHDTNIPVNHPYLATYQWLRERVGIDALVHLGTHGTQEWLKGKERGLSVFDDPYLIVGDTPVFYPYIADNLAEGIQAKRRGRAVLISHLTPPFAVTGTFNDMSDIVRLINEHESAGVESIKEQAYQSILKKAVAAQLHKDMGWDEARARRDRAGFIAALQDFLMSLSNQAQPLGNHTLGSLPKHEHMVSTLALMLGKDFLIAADGPDAAQARDYTTFAKSNAARLLADHVIDGKPDTRVDAVLRPWLDTARAHYQRFRQSDELGSLLSGLEGRYIATGYGGDVVRNPDLLPTGRNMYAFDPAKVPTRTAYETGRKLAEQTLEDYKKQHGRYPEKLVFNLWSLETMRHFGVMEAQILALMGVRPIWNEGGVMNQQVADMIRSKLKAMPSFISNAAANTITGDRLLALAQRLPASTKAKIPFLPRMQAARNMGRDDIVDVEIIPAAELKRPRIDVVISVTGLYRDTFPGPIKRLAEAAQKVAELDEDNNFVRRNMLALRGSLINQGLAREEAQVLSTVRVFSSQVGQYGNGVSDTAMASNTWDKDDKIAKNYLERLGYYFGTDEKHWGEKRAGLDLYAKNLVGADAVMFSRTSNLYGLLTSDDPFGYFGALSLAIRNLSGKTPDSLIANLRDANRPAMEPTARFMAKELKGRQFHPQWITAQRDQGYSGTLNVLDSVENFWGWQVVDPTTVRDDQWQEFHDVYVRDKLKLGTRAWFENQNPRALAQIAERMLEANRKGYWQADSATLKELVEVVEAAIQRHDFRPMNDKVLPFVEQLKSAGYGLDFIAPSPDKMAAQPPQIEGQRLEKQSASTTAAADLPTLLITALALIAAPTLAGAWRQSSASAIRFPFFTTRSPA